MLGARLHDDSPEEFVRFVSEQLCEGGAQPVIFNDEAIAKGLSKISVAIIISTANIKMRSCCITRQ